MDDKELRRDISINKQMLNKKEVSSVSLCSGKEQMADCMTKEEYVWEKGVHGKLVEFQGKRNWRKMVLLYYERNMNV